MCAHQGATDSARRLELYRQADRMLMDEALCLPLVYERLHFLVRPWVRSLPTSPQSWWFWKDITLGPRDEQPEPG